MSSVMAVSGHWVSAGRPSDGSGWRRAALAAALALAAVQAGCVPATTGTRFVFDYPPAEAAAFRRASAACSVEELKVVSPLLARREPEWATVLGNKAFAACMQGKGYRLIRTERA
jgi:hypothetical protein